MITRGLAGNRVMDVPAAWSWSPRSAGPALMTWPRLAGAPSHDALRDREWWPIARRHGGSPEPAALFESRIKVVPFGRTRRYLRRAPNAGIALLAVGRWWPSSFTTAAWPEPHCGSEQSGGGSSRTDGCRGDGLCPAWPQRLIFQHRISAVRGRDADPRPISCSRRDEPRIDLTSEGVAIKNRGDNVAFAPSVLHEVNGSFDPGLGFYLDRDGPSTAECASVQEERARHLTPPFF